MGTGWGDRRRYASLGGGTRWRGGGWRWGVAVLAAMTLFALRHGRLTNDRLVADARTAVARAATTPVAMRPAWQAELTRLEDWLRGGLDGRGWRWPPVDGGMRVRAIPEHTPPMRYPVAGVLLVPFGGGVDPVSGRHVGSDGIVLGAQAGSPVRAPCAGTVLAVTDGPPVGRAIELRPDGRPEVTVALLGVAGVTVRPGQAVVRGAVLGTVPHVGPASVPGLVLEVRIHGIPVDPLSPLFLGPTE